MRRVASDVEGEPVMYRGLDTKRRYFKGKNVIILSNAAKSYEIRT